MTAALTAHAARSGLEELARTWDGLPWFTRERTLCALVSGAWGEGGHSHPVPANCVCGWCLGCAWYAFCDDLARLDGLNGEVWATPVSWVDVDERLAGNHDAAVDEMNERVAGDLDLLTRGPSLRGQWRAA